MSRPYDVLVIGGGTSGMSAAIAAAQKGVDVILLEAGNHIGGQLLTADNGNYYVTNEQVGPENYYDADPAVLKEVLGNLPGSTLQTWLEEIGLALKSDDGRICPASEQAVDVRDALRLQLNSRFVRVETYQKVISINKTQDGLFEVVGIKATFYAKKVVLAAGSKSLETGMDGSGCRLAEELGMEVKKPLPALTSLRLFAPCSGDWDGVRCDGEIRLFVDGEQVCASTGSLQLSASGVSGTPAMNVSRYVSRALDEGKEVKAELSFLPGMTVDEAFEFLMKRFERVKDYLAREYLIGLIPKKLARSLIRQAGIRHSKPIHYLREEDVRRLAEVMTALPAEVTGHGNFRQAQVCTGGVVTSEVVPETLESRKVPGLYLAGELLDVDGMCGGYNLQWAFSSGYTAGASAVENLERGEKNE